ncbi:hypothetical protein Gotur_010114 [Gossypium turneri]
MSGFSESNVSSQNSRGTKRKWVPKEDAALVSCMVNLHNVGTFNANRGFKTGYLNELEKMLEKALPNAMLKAKHNIESRIKVLKRDWSIMYDMLNRKNNSGFDQLTAIYAKDRAIGKDAQTATDIIEQINVEDVATTNIHEERNDFYGCEAGVSLDDMDVSATDPQPDRNQEGLTVDERYRASSKISDHPTQMLIFFSLPSSVRLEWVRRFLAHH